MPDVFTPWGLQDFVEHFLLVLKSESGIDFDENIGSVAKSLASANATNMLFLQSQIANVFLKSRLSTCVGDDVDSYVAQFAPAFESRKDAQQASSYPAASVRLSSLPLVVIPATDAQGEEIYFRVTDTTECPLPGTPVQPTLQIDGQTSRVFVKVLAAAPVATLLAVDVANDIITLGVRDVDMATALAIYNMCMVPGAPLFVQLDGTAKSLTVANDHVPKYVASATDVSGWETDDLTTTNIKALQVADMVGTRVRLNLDFTVKVTATTAASVAALLGGAVQAQYGLYAINNQHTRRDGSILTMTNPADFYVGGINGYTAPVHFVAGTPGVRFTATTPIDDPIIISIGAKVANKDSTVVYKVVEDADHYLYVPATIDIPAHYVLPADDPNGQDKPTYPDFCLPVKADVGGVASNIGASQLTSTPVPLTGVSDTINDFAIMNGREAELDDDVKDRFRLWILSLPNGTYTAIQAAIKAAMPDLVFNLIERVSEDGITPAVGKFLVIASDDMGSLTTKVKAQIASIVDDHKPYSSQYKINAPVVTIIPVTATLALDPTPDNTRTSILLAVQTALVDYINSVPPGTKIYFSKIGNIISSITGVRSIVRLLVRGAGYSLDSPSGYGGQSTFTLGATPTDLVPRSPYEMFRTSAANVTIDSK